MSIKPINIFTITISIFVLGFISCKKLDLKQIGAVTTESVDIAGSKVQAHGTVVDVSEKGVSDHGHCWGTSSEPTVDGLHSSLGPISEPATYVSSIENLNINTTYYVRAYILTDGEYIYSNGFSPFFSIGTDDITITTGTYNIDDESTATIDGSIAGVGSLELLDYGHCWSTSNTPTISDMKISKGAIDTDMGFTSTLEGLQMDLAYYYRSYLQVDDNTVLYGDVVDFTIPSLKVITGGATQVPTFSVSLNGTLYLGIYHIQEYGFCWSYTSSSPDYNDNKVLGSFPAQSGTYNCIVANVDPMLTYYYRAFAYDGHQIVYGDIGTF